MIIKSKLIIVIGVIVFVMDDVVTDVGAVVDVADVFSQSSFFGNSLNSTFWDISPTTNVCFCSTTVYLNLISSLNLHPSSGAIQLTWISFFKFAFVCVIVSSELSHSMVFVLEFVFSNFPIIFSFLSRAWNGYFFHDYKCMNRAQNRKIFKIEKSK